MQLGSVKIRSRRKELGLSQLELAERAGVSLRTIQFAEAGKRMNRETLELIALGLNWDHEELLYLRTDGPHDDRDAFQQVPWSLFQFVRKRLRPNKLAFCTAYEDANTAVAQMRNSWQTHLARSCSQNEDNIFGIADRIMSEQYDEYEQKYLSIWKRNPNTLLFCTANKTRTGMSVILPVSDEAYEKLLTGKISYMEITADDIREKSQNLIVDSAVEFPDTSNLAWYQLTESLSFTVFSHMAMLAKNPAADDFRMISFGASPINIQRLKSIGFAPSGEVTMPQFGFPICEFVGNSSDLPDESYEKTSTVSHVLHLLNRHSISNAKIIAKRKLITSGLRGLQLVGNTHRGSTKASDKRTAA